MTGVPTRDVIQAGGVELHVRHINPPGLQAPLVFLHEALGSVELWRDFPDAVAAATGRHAMVYSRRGNGWSMPLDRPRRPDYLHEEAATLGVVLAESGLGAGHVAPPILIGHSDGASIAAIYAGCGHPVTGLVLIAPHVFVEPEAIASIAAIREDFEKSDLPTRMAKYHVDPEATFSGWADIWLSPDFRAWNIEHYVAAIDSPVALIQGDADEYGTERQLDAIDAALGGPARRLMVAGGHSPHLDDSKLVTEFVVDFIGGIHQ